MTFEQIKKNQHPGFRFYIIALIITITISQTGSYIVNNTLHQGETVRILPFLHFTHLRNLGGIFGMLQGMGALFGLLSILIVFAITFYVYYERRLTRLEYICLGLIAGGGSSNTLDRVIYGSVIDFIDIRGIPFWHYIFNTADTFIHLGIWPMIIMLFFHPTDDDQTDMVDNDAQV